MDFIEWISLQRNEAEQAGDHVLARMCNNVKYKNDKTVRTEAEALEYCRCKEQELKANPLTAHHAAIAKSIAKAIRQELWKPKKERKKEPKKERRERRDRDEDDD